MYSLEGWRPFESITSFEEQDWAGCILVTTNKGLHCPGRWHSQHCPAGPVPTWIPGPLGFGKQPQFDRQSCWTSLCIAELVFTLFGPLSNQQSYHAIAPRSSGPSGVVWHADTTWIIWSQPAVSSRAWPSSMVQSWYHCHILRENPAAWCNMPWKLCMYCLLHAQHCVGTAQRTTHKLDKY